MLKIYADMPLMHPLRCSPSALKKCSIADEGINEARFGSFEGCFQELTSSDKTCSLLFVKMKMT